MKGEGWTHSVGRDHPRSRVVAQQGKSRRAADGSQCASKADEPSHTLEGEVE